MRTNTKSGSALLTVLGILAIVTLLVLAYAFATRTERMAARRARDAMTAEGHIDSIISLIMSRELPIHTLSARENEYGNSLSRFTGKINFAGLSAILRGNENYMSRHAFTSCLPDTHDCGVCRDFLHNLSTNYIPAALHSEITRLDADWIPIESVDEDTGDTIYTNTLYAYAVIDASGFLDANCITSNQVAWLEEYGTDIDSTKDFLADRARQSAPALDSGITGYVSYRDLYLRNRGLADPPQHLLHTSYSPAPDVTVTNGTVYSDYASANRFPALMPKFDINSWTNDYNGALDDTEALTTFYASSKFKEGWLRETTNRLAYCGFAAAEPLAWNLINFLDGDRIPQAPSETAWRDEWPVEDVPLINEFAVAQVPLSFGYTNCYAAAVELWYPFTTNKITEADNASLVVAVYTNWTAAAEHYETVSTSDKGYLDELIFLNDDSEYGFSFSNRIERMENGTTTEFAIITAQPEHYVSFPAEVVNFSSSGEFVANVIKKNEDATDLWKETSDANPDGQILRRHTENLPLGIHTYSTYRKSETADDEWVMRNVTVTNEIRLVMRVMLNGHWVDEAMAYDPDPDSGYTEEPYAFHSPCGWQTDDPRRNGHRSDWERYEGASYFESEETGNTTYTCTLSGTTNSLCNPWGTYGQGLPIVHFNGPVARAGDIGYISEPFSSFNGGETVTSNKWQSICLADSRVLASHGTYAFSAGSVLELFTARCATNHSVRGLVSATTPYGEVMGALFADMEIGHALQRTRLPESTIGWMTNVFVSTQSVMYEGDSIPIGVGDFCMAVGEVNSFRDIPDEYISEEDDEWHWDGSLGNEIKEDILRELAERLTFRQQIFIVVLDVRTTTPALSVSAERRVVAVVVRDAYSGAWRIAEIYKL